MEAAELRKLGNEYMQIWSAGNEDLLDKFAHKSLTAKYTHFDKSYQGIDEYKSVLKMTYGFFPDMKIHIKRIIPNEQEKNAIVLWEYQGTHMNGNLFGVDSSLKNVNVSGITLLEMDQGLVVKEDGIVDNLSLILQLGAMG